MAVKKNQNSSSVNLTPSPTPFSKNISGGPIQPQISPTPSVDSIAQNQINIDSPETESIVANSQINLKGTTNANSRLIISTPVDTYYATATTTGSFGLNVEIESGINLIQIDSIDLNDNQATAQINITYSTAKF